VNVTETLVTDQIIPIRIPTPFPVGDVFSYLIKDDKTILVDCGYKSDDSWALMQDALKEHGRRIEDVDEIWLTHAHVDHCGLAMRIQEASGASILAHPLDKIHLRGNDAERFQNFFSTMGIPEKLIASMGKQLMAFRQFMDPVDVSEWVHEGDELHSGSQNFKVLHTPGHAPGHISMVNESGVSFGGDVLLQHITTNAFVTFNCETGERNHSLQLLRDSLDRFLSDRFKVVAPGHGKVMRDEEIAATVRHHKSEQEKRYGFIRRQLQKKPFSLYELALKLFPQTVESDQAFLTLSEVMGYLDWGMDNGDFKRDDDGDHPVFWAAGVRGER
jgi:glyoxylase-like metal-dependent hydrolase (beta-lactamase superfamily II)